MTDASDMELIREYAGRNSETAFAELVDRHIPLVHSVALRFTRNPGDAQDVTQAVFIILARKAGVLRPDTILTGWLYETTRFTAMKLLRTQARQQARERAAYMESTMADASPGGVWKQLGPLLEEGMTGLNQKERTLLALRFFENKSGAQTAAILGIQEWAAHKRTNRAVEKLRAFFTKRGIVLSAVALTAAISANSVQAAPGALASSVTAAAVAKGSMATASTLALAQETMTLMAWLKAKTAASIAAGVLLAAGTATVAVSTYLREQGTSAKAPAQALAAVQPAKNPGNPGLPGALAQLAPLPAANVPKIAVPTRQNPPEPLIYPTAPTLGDILAAAQAAGGARGGILMVPPGLHFQNQYGNLFQKLKLTPGQIAAFIKILEDKQTQEGNFMRANQLDRTTLTNLTRAEMAAAQQEHFQQMQVLMKPMEEAADLQIKQLLGSDADYNYYLTYNAQQKERAVIMNGYRTGLVDAGVPPLTLDQDEQLIGLVYQARMGANNDPVLEGRQIPQVLQQAAGFLTSDQIKVFEQYTKSLLSPTNGGAGVAIGSIGTVPRPPPGGN
jgi:RNA polymerase sigma factor (sigma-70 family)